ncbi:MAG: GNAT family N-acetyltransferase [Clostridia bacterium]|nr:GNAT family N-acetyltransferase [Clostridia bacterium]
MKVVLKRPRGVLGWRRVYRSYLQGFPPSERKPFWLIVRMTWQGKTDTWCLYAEGKFAGFCSTINGREAVLLDYLAVSPALQGKGIGTQTLHALQEKYRDRGLFVEIESPFEEGPDQSERIRRKQFYRACGMEPFGVMANVFGVKMELLGRNCLLDYEAYHEFYLENYSAYAAEHLQELPYPKQ